MTPDFLYKTTLGRILLKPLTSRALSKAVGAFMETRASKLLIPRFVKKNAIDLDDYETEGWRSFNDFFCRQIKDGRRPCPRETDVLVAPCDGLLTAYRIQDGLVLPIKQSEYSIERLLDDATLAANYRNGLCLVFRLCVWHYHRYAYIETGRKLANRFIPGKLHTVQPIALENRPVFVENCRDYAVIETPNLGKVVQLEVGAMMVGRIENLERGEAEVRRGEEKGRFLFGGSTVVALIEEGRVELDSQLLAASSRGEETPVRLGAVLGKASAQAN